MGYRLTEADRRDLEEVWESIANDNEPAADRFIAALKDHGEMLGRNPRAGHRRDEAQICLRIFPY